MKIRHFWKLGNKYLKASNSFKFLVSHNFFKQHKSELKDNYVYFLVKSVELNYLLSPVDILFWAIDSNAFQLWSQFEWYTKSPQLKDELIPQIDDQVHSRLLVN
jgi:hypothetical protein